MINLFSVTPFYSIGARIPPKQFIVILSSIVGGIDTKPGNDVVLCGNDLGKFESSRLYLAIKDKHRRLHSDHRNRNHEDRQNEYLSSNDSLFAIHKLYKILDGISQVFSQSRLSITCLLNIMLSSSSSTTLRSPAIR